VSHLLNSRPDIRSYLQRPMLICMFSSYRQFFVFCCMVLSYVEACCLVMCELVIAVFDSDGKLRIIMNIILLLSETVPKN